MDLANDWNKWYYLQELHPYHPSESSTGIKLMAVGSTLFGNDWWNARYCNAPNTPNLGKQSVYEFFKYFMNSDMMASVVEPNPLIFPTMSTGEEPKCKYGNPSVLM